MNDDFNFVDDKPISIYEPTRERVAYALNTMLFDRIGAIPSIVTHLVDNYYNQPNVLQFADFFCTYWALSGKTIFEHCTPKDETHLQRIKREEKVIDEKFKQWLELMDYAVYEKILDDKYL